MSLEDFAKGAGRATASAYDDAAAKWGRWRRFIARNPLTGFWCGVVIGAVLLGWPLGALRWPL